MFASGSIKTILFALAVTGCCHTLYLAGTQLLLVNRTRANLLIACFYFGIWFIFLDVLILMSLPAAAFDHVPSLEFWSILPRFFLGPLVFVYFAMMVSDPGWSQRPGKQSRFADRLHLVPGALLLLLGSLLLANDLYLGSIGNEEVFGCQLCERIQLEITKQVSRTALITGGNMYIALYLLPVLWLLGRLLLFGEQKRAALAAGLIATGALAATVLQTLGTIYNTIHGGAGVAGISLLLLVLYAVALLGQRFPRFLQTLQLEARRLTRRENRLRDLSTEELQRSLDALMESEKVYQDEDLRLPTVATLLDVTPHQLSYYLNHVLKVDFARYVNRYRIQAAQEALRSPGRQKDSVLDIGYAAGFNSKTAFYRAFGEATGMSPLRYRNLHTKSNP